MSVVLVGGGAGGVGEGIVRHLLQAGHTTVVPSRSEAKLELVRERLAAAAPLERFVGFLGNAGDPQGALAVRERIFNDYARIDAVIPSLGGWWEGRPLVEIEVDEWDAIMDEMLRTHFVFARTFVPLLQAQGSGRYIAIGGGAAYFPVPLAAPVSVAAAAQVMLTRALRAEVHDPRIDILELVIDGPVRTRLSEEIARPGWIELDEIGPIVVDLVERGETDDPRARTDGPIVSMRSFAAREVAGWHG